jgi:hypothetical protein
MERFGGSPATSGRSTISQTVSSSKAGTSAVPFLTTKQFLRLVQPIDETTLPIPRLASKGQTYTFPFTFVIPQSLLPTACTHTTENQAVKYAHLRLPPSLGDPSVLSQDKDDLAPDMTRISYAIRVRVARMRDADGKTVVLADSSRKIAVSPEFPDEPPVHIENKSKDFVLRKEKDLRKGLLGRKIGRICVFAEQPQPLRLAPNSPCPPSTTVPVSLTFTPANSEIPPPGLSNLTAKLKTSTYFSTTRATYIPTPSRATPDPSIGNYTESTLLSSRCISNVKWENNSSSSKPVYAAQVVVPITVPKCKHLVPSFSTCFVNRSYILDLSVSVCTSNHNQTSLNLKLPLQISQPSKDALEYANTDTGIGEFFTPRIITPSTLLQENVIMPPPSFEDGEPRQQREESISQLPQSMLVRPPNRMPPPGYSVFGNAGGLPARIPDPIGISPGCG